MWASLEYVQNVLIPTIMDEYRHAFEYRFSRRDRGSDHIDEKNRGQEKVSTSLRGDPTGDTAVDQKWLTGKLITIAPKVFTVEKACRGIRASLGELFEDPEEEFGPMRRDPIPDSTQTDARKAGERFQDKRHLQDEIDRHRMEAARLERQLREVG